MITETVGDITPSEKIPKEEKTRREAVGCWLRSTLTFGTR